MSAERKFRPSIMTAKDREFDALLRRAAQHFEQVTMAMQTQKTPFKNASIVASQTPYPASYADKG